MSEHSGQPATTPHKRTLTIALINNLFPPYIVGGNEILARDVIKALRARGHTVHVLTGHGANLPDDGFTHSALDIDLDDKDNYFLGGIPLTLARMVRWHLYNRRTARGVRETLARLQPDLVIAWNLYMASAAPLIAARSVDAPLLAHPADKWLLYSLDDITKLVPATTRAQRMGLGFIRGMVQPLLKRRAMPDYLLCVSEFIRKLHTEAGYPSAQSAATWLGIEPATFSHQPHTHPGTDSARPWRLIFAGQLWAGKGPQVAVEAVRILRSRAGVPPVELDIYGGGAEGFKTWLQAQIEEKGVADAVKLRGFASTPDLVQAFHDHDIYLFCSIWDEPFSGGLLEAMATGLPTIATTAGGTREGVVHERNGLLVAPDDPVALADAIQRLMQQPDLYTAIGAQAAADVRAQWTFSQYIDRLEQHYRAIVAGHRKGAPITLAATPPLPVPPIAAQTQAQESEPASPRAPAQNLP